MRICPLAHPHAHACRRIILSAQDWNWEYYVLYGIMYCPTLVRAARLREAEAWLEVLDFGSMSEVDQKIDWRQSIGSGKCLEYIA